MGVVAAGAVSFGLSLGLGSQSSPSSTTLQQPRQHLVQMPLRPVSVIQSVEVLYEHGIQHCTSCKHKWTENRVDANGCNIETRPSSAASGFDTNRQRRTATGSLIVVRCLEVSHGCRDLLVMRRHSWIEKVSYTSRHVADDLNRYSDSDRRVESRGFSGDR